jgi:hypothetical protein
VPDQPVRVELVDGQHVDAAAEPDWLPARAGQPRFGPGRVLDLHVVVGVDLHGGEPVDPGRPAKVVIQHVVPDYDQLRPAGLRLAGGPPFPLPGDLAV